MKRTWRWLRISLAALLLGGLMGGGIALYFNLQRSTGYYLKAGEAALQAGLNAFAAHRDQEATQLFHEAWLHADNALQKLAQDAEAQPPQTPEAGLLLTRQEGFAQWLKMRAIRGRSWAQARLEGKTLPALPPGETAAAYFARITPNRLPDEASRAAAATALRDAAVRLPDQLAIQTEAVNFEMQVEPKQWPLAQIVASQLLALQPKDERALYILARFEFEQPILAVAGEGLTPGTPMPTAKRSRERMLKCLDYLKQLTTTPEGQRWRTLYLEAQARHWLVQYYRQPERAKFEEEQKEVAALKRLLLDEETGLAARLAKMDEKAPLSRLDTEGLLGLHTLALELLVDELRRGQRRDEGSRVNTLRQLDQLLQSQATWTQQILSREPTAAQIEAAIEQLTTSATRTQLLLGGGEMPVWTKVVQTLQSTGELALNKGVAEPRVYVLLADLWSREAEQVGQKGQAARKAELRRQAVLWCDRGLQVCQEKKLAATALVPLHEAAGRTKLLAGSDSHAVAPHLEALKASKMPMVQAAAFLLEGSLCEREGKLEQARQAFERAAQLGQGTDLARRANTMLAPLCLTLQQPEAALKALRELERMHGSWARLTDEERAWLFNVVRSPQDVTYLKLQAHLQAAAQAWQRSQKKNASPATSLESPLQVVQRHEQEAQQAFEKLPADSVHYRAAIERWVEHLLQTQRLPQAEQMLARLRQLQPDSVAVLRLETQLSLARPAAAGRTTQVAAIDERIRQFLTTQPTNTAAKLFWAEWLLRTGRGEQAAAFLDDVRQFPQQQSDPRWQRVRLVVQLAQPSASSAPSPILQAEVRDLKSEADLVQAAASGEDQEQLSPAPARHENLLLNRLLQARQAEGRRDWAEAARIYVSLLDATQLRSIVRSHLQTTLGAWAQTQPDQARALLTQCLQSRPAEPVLLLGYAQCCLFLGDWGEPTDRGTQVNNMATALHAFEAALTQAGGDPTLGPWTKAVSWKQAGKLDAARREVVRLLSINGRHEGALVLRIQIELQAGDPASLQAVAPDLATFQSLQPNSPSPLLLKAQVEEKLGQYAAARQTYEQTVQRFPNSGAAYAGWVALLHRQGDTAGALAVVKKWRGALPADMTAAQAEVRCLALTGQAAETRAVRAQVHSAIQSRLLARKERVAEAEWPALTQHAEREKQAATVMLAQGLIQGKAWEEAQIWLQTVLDITPDYEPALLALGDLHLERLAAAAAPTERADAAQQARAALSRVYQQRQGHLIAGSNLAWLYATELKNPEEALRLAQEVRQNRFTRQPQPVELLPAELLDTFGLVYAQLARPELQKEWRAMFETACRRYPQDARMAAHLAQACRAGGDAAAAAAHTATAKRLLGQPTSPLTPAQKQRVTQMLSGG